MTVIEQLIEDMDAVIDDAHPIPFASHKIIIDGDRMRELINEMRINIPPEIKRAKLIDFDCDRIINEAHKKSEIIVQEAEIKAKKIIDEQVIVREAEKKAIDIINTAQNNASQLRAAAEGYIIHLLNNAESYFNENLNEVQQTKNKIINRKR
ncbi:MAG: vacuolar-type H+-ATPase subunit H [Ruminococcus sp.]|nr:vacuolar-type H+-ATPase subunit H [Ruminococcus sp.]